jgi:hypothetical protein
LGIEVESSVVAVFVVVSELDAELVVVSVEYGIVLVIVVVELVESLRIVCVVVKA